MMVSLRQKQQRSVGNPTRVFISYRTKNGLRQKEMLWKGVVQFLQFSKCKKSPDPNQKSTKNSKQKRSNCCCGIQSYRILLLLKGWRLPKRICFMNADGDIVKNLIPKSIRSWYDGSSDEETSYSDSES